jgi:hypothetical protein
MIMKAEARAQGGCRASERKMKMTGLHIYVTFCFAFSSIRKVSEHLDLGSVYAEEINRNIGTTFLRLVTAGFLKIRDNLWPHMITAVLRHLS